ncbi:hypothetical protein [Cupriavidus sp. AcVe19-1a]|uniref:hypothetical protein n=1 Tax=Cupriavidus sp. AcVe19-1a TaxID=2821359 RepID=UPI001AE4A2C3|nr:hypothetical protein [Cupriavidus sp. AcVe19-1a]MBP0630573.1 hypothetical protein [Cupriavidus sp. AcVe19-1a]
MEISNGYAWPVSRATSTARLPIGSVLRNFFQAVEGSGWQCCPGALEIWTGRQARDDAQFTCWGDSFFKVAAGLGIERQAPAVQDLGKLLILLGRVCRFWLRLLMAEVALPL